MGQIFADFRSRCDIMSEGMGLITVSGQPGSRHEEVARLAAQRLGFELVSESRLQAKIAEEFGDAPLRDKAYPALAAMIVARLSTERHLIVCFPGAEFLVKGFPSILRVSIVAPESRRIGTLMVDRHLDRPAAKHLLRQMELADKSTRKKRFGRISAPAETFDLILGAERLDSEHMALLIETATVGCGMIDAGLLSTPVEAQLQFELRLQLAKYGISAPGKVALKTTSFVHPSEEIFANLLDFYRIPWEYEPRSFPIQWGKDGKVLEAFTPDFYLPEFDLYVELTTMKQSLVTKKNRKVKLLRTIYPHINIQVFYQKDFKNLIFKYGLAERVLHV